MFKVRANQNITEAMLLDWDDFACASETYIPEGTVGEITRIVLGHVEGIDFPDSRVKFRVEFEKRGNWYVLPEWLENVETGA